MAASSSVTEIFRLPELRKEVETNIAQVLELLTRKTGDVAAAAQITLDRATAKLNKYGNPGNDQESFKAQIAFKKINEEVLKLRNALTPSPGLSGKILYVMTGKDLKTGLNGVPTSTCSNSHVDPNEGVSYAGVPIKEVAKRSFTETLFLLDKLRYPTVQEEADFNKRLDEAALMDLGLEDPPYFDDPMDMLHVGLLKLAEAIKRKMMDEPNLIKRYERDGLILRAKLPFIIASIINTHSGHSTSDDYSPDLSYLENFKNMLLIPLKDKGTELLDLFLVLHAAHGGGNLSTSTACYVASGRGDLCHAMAAGTIALQTPLHGGANCESFKMIQDALETGDAATFVHALLDKKGLVYGFGHRVLSKTDPRTLVGNEFGKEHFPNDPYVQMSLKLQEVVPGILKERTNIRNPFPNVDVITGPLLNAIGIDPKFATLFFAWSRMAGGIFSQVMEDTASKVPIHRPSSVYTGPGAKEIEEASLPLNIGQIAAVQRMINQLERVLNEGTDDEPGQLLDKINEQLLFLVERCNQCQGPEKDSFAVFLQSLEEQKQLFISRTLQFVEIEKQINDFKQRSDLSRDELLALEHQICESGFACNALLKKNFIAILRNHGIEADGLTADPDWTRLQTFQTLLQTMQHDVSSEELRTAMVKGSLSYFPTLFQYMLTFGCEGALGNPENIQKMSRFIMNALSQSGEE